MASPCPLSLFHVSCSLLTVHPFPFYGRSRNPSWNAESGNSSSPESGEAGPESSHSPFSVHRSPLTNPRVICSDYTKNAVNAPSSTNKPARNPLDWGRQKALTEVAPARRIGVDSQAQRYDDPVAVQTPAVVRTRVRVYLMRAGWRPP